jgi:hypothetical protein
MAEGLYNVKRIIAACLRAREPAAGRRLAGPLALVW